MIISYYKAKDERVAPSDVENKNLIRSKLADKDCREVRHETVEDFIFLARELRFIARNGTSSIPLALLTWGCDSLSNIAGHSFQNAAARTAIQHFTMPKKRERGRPASTNTAIMAGVVYGLVKNGTSMTQAVQTVAKDFNKDESVVRKAYYRKRESIQLVEEALAKIGQKLF